MGAVMAAGSIGGAAIQSNAAGKAASAQAGAANNAAQLQYLSGQNALDFQKQVWQTQQSNQAPWLQAGGNAVSTLDQLMGLNPVSPGTGGSATVPNMPQNPRGANQLAANTPGGVPGGTPSGTPTPPPLQNIPGASPYARGIGLLGGSNPELSAPISLNGAQPHGTAMLPGSASSALPNAKPGTAPGMSNGQLVPFAPWNQKFTAPTAADARATPGYQFLQDQGTQAVQNSAAARGDLLSGNTLTDLTKFGQGLADTTYDQTYNRALQQYQQNYNIYENNQNNQWNRLASLSGMGQTAVGQLNSAGSGAASNVGNILMGTSNNMGRDIMAAGGATATGYANQGNAWGGAVSSLSNLVPFLSMMNGGNQAQDNGWNYPGRG